MAWLAVDKDETEVVFGTEPFREHGTWNVYSDAYVLVPVGTIEKILGYKLSWEDGAVLIGEQR